MEYEQKTFDHRHSNYYDIFSSQYMFVSCYVVHKKFYKPTVDYRCIDVHECRKLIFPCIKSITHVGRKLVKKKRHILRYSQVLPHPVMVSV